MPKFKLTKQPPLRKAELKWEEVGPGLYDDGEVMVALDETHYAAVSVKHEWLENGAGVSFTGTARWCDKNGQTHLCPDGKHIESHITISVHPSILAQHKFDDIKRDVLLLLLGEDAELTNGDGDLVINLHDSVRLNASIRHQIETVNAVKKSAGALAILKG